MVDCFVWRRCSLWIVVITLIGKNKNENENNYRLECLFYSVHKLWHNNSAF